jgi:hypothetical protein
MNTSESQFESKGSSPAELNNRAVEQRIQEMDITRKMTPAAQYERDVVSGVQGAKNVVNLNPTIAEATSNPDTLGGPVSGAALAKAKAAKIEKKKTVAKEMKRR